MSRWLILALIAGLSFASASHAQSEASAPEKRAIPTEGFWPTKTMVDRILDRISDDMSEQYEFDDDQKMRTRELLKNMIPKFMEENRAEIQELTNQFIESQIDDEPPTTEEMSGWAQRVLPLVGKMSAMAEEMTGRMHEYMNDDQIVKLETEFAAFQTGIGFVNSKLGTWSEGGFDPESEWVPPGPERRRRDRAEEREMKAAMDASRQEARAAMSDAQAAQSGETHQPAAPQLTSKPTDEWTAFAEELIRKYELNSEQEQKARTILRIKQDERDRFLQQKAADVARVTQLGVDAKTDEEKTAATEAAARLKAPVDRMFNQLKDRLETIPTRAQRQAVARRESAASQPTSEKTE